MAETNIKAIIPGDLRKVWDFVFDIENYDTWRSDLGKTEIISEKQFGAACLLIKATKRR